MAVAKPPSIATEGLSKRKMEIEPPYFQNRIQYIVGSAVKPARSDG